MPATLLLHLLTQYYFIVTCPVSKLPLWPPLCLCTRAGLLIVTVCRCAWGDSWRGGIDGSIIATLPAATRDGELKHSSAPEKKLTLLLEHLPPWGRGHSYTAARGKGAVIPTAVVLQPLMEKKKAADKGKEWMRALHLERRHQGKSW